MKRVLFAEPKHWRCPGPILRIVGAALVVLAAILVQRLSNWVQPGRIPTLLAYLAGSAAFVCASLGSTILLLGARCYERVPLARRWVDCRRLGRPMP